MWGYDTMSAVQADLLANARIIDLNGDVDRRMFDYVREAIVRLRAEGCPDITVLITCPGGGCQMGLGIFDLLNNYPGKVTGEIFGFAKSMAAIILQACDIRLAAEHSAILLHNPNSQNIDYAAINDKSGRLMDEERESLEFSRQCMLNIISRRSGLDAKRLATIFKQAKNLTPDQALKLKLIDGIMDNPNKEAKRVSARTS